MAGVYYLSVKKLNEGPNNTIGVVMGEEIDAMYYRQEVQEEMQRNRSQRPQLTDADREQIENNVWNRLTMTKVIDAQRKALGIEVTPQEIFDVTSLTLIRLLKELLQIQRQESLALL